MKTLLFTDYQQESDRLFPLPQGTLSLGQKELSSLVMLRHNTSLVLISFPPPLGIFVYSSRFAALPDDPRETKGYIQSVSMRRVAHDGNGGQGFSTTL